MSQQNTDDMDDDEMLGEQPNENQSEWDMERQLRGE